MSGRISGGNATGTPQLLNMKNMCRLSIARSPRSADEMALRTFVLIWSVVRGSSNVEAGWTIVQLSLV